MKQRSTCLLVLVLLLQTGIGIVFRYIEATAYVRILSTQIIALLVSVMVYLILFRMPAAVSKGRGFGFCNGCLAIVVILCVGVLNQYINMPILYFLSLYRTPPDVLMRTPQTGFEFVLAVCMLCVIPSIIEEILFRGIALREYSAVYGTRRAVIGTAVVYAIFHFDISAFIPQLILGLVIAYLVSSTGSLAIGILAHCIHNFFNLLMQQYIDWFTVYLMSYPVFVVTGAVAMFLAAGWGVYKYNLANRKKVLFSK